MTFDNHTNGLTCLLNRQLIDVEYTDNEILKLEKFKSDYNVLIHSLLELQKSVSKTAYLPFSSKALVLGKLVHTNEVLIYLGGSDEFFAEVSVFEAVNILERRITKLDLKIKDMNKQKLLLLDRIKYTKEHASHKLVSKKKGESDYCVIEDLKEYKEVEIREDYNSDDELEWRKKHTLKRVKERQLNSTRESPNVLHRKVHFNLDVESNSLSGSDSNEDLCTILFKHSNVCSPVIRTDVTDMSTLTVAEAVDMFNCKNLNINNTANNDRKPFGDITEHLRSSTEVEVLNDYNPTRISKFRSSRISNN